MNILKIKFIIGAFLFSASVASQALTLSSNSFNLNVGDSVTVQLSQIRGTVSYSNTNTSLVSVSKISTTQYKIKAFKSGTSKVTFRDRNGSSTVTVTVASSAAPALNGRLLSSNCFQCHGTNGSGGFEKLSGSSEADILSELREFASGKEDSTGIMAAHTMGYTDSQLQSIAKYFSTIK
jgi:sulfide dehydrogenase cytochrome subunit